MSPRLAALAVTFLLAGCVAVPERTQMQSAGRYGELVAHEERETAGQGPVSTQRLFDLCYGYSKVKNYRKIFDCADRMERQVAQGDTGIVPPGTARAGIGAGAGAWAIGPTDGSAYPWILRSEALIDLGKYERAATEAWRAVALCAQVKSLAFAAERTECHISALGLAGLASALAGDAASARKAADGLKALPLEFVGIAMSSMARNLALARIDVAQGDCHRALELLGDGTAGLRAFVNALFGQHSKSSSLFAHLELPFHYLRARCLLETGRVADARSAMDGLLAYPQVADNGEIYWMLLFDRGRIAEAEGDRARAIGLYRRAIEVIERQRSTISTEASKIGFVGDKQAVYRHVVSALVATEDRATAFEYLERAKSRALVDLLASKRDFAVAGGDARKAKALLAEADAAEEEAMLQGAPGAASSSRGIAVEARRRLGEESPELASLVSVGALSAREVQALVPPDETLLEYFQADRELLAFVVTRGSLEVVRLDASGLAQDLARFRRDVADPRSDRQAALARRLHARLVAPLAGRIATRDIAVVAHGPLHYLPFNALHDGSAHLIDRYGLRMLPSASVLRFLRPKPEAQAGDVLAFGNPDLGDPRFDLAYAQAEVAAIARGRPASRVLVRKEATESAFRQLAGGFRYVHFATHGAFDPGSPLESTLMLAPEARGDGRLTADKLYSMRLHADLVTLSACETGLGKVASGDDVVGLTRAFLYAGSRSIVASLWKVDDEATSYLMTRFYEGLGRTDKRNALRQAQIATRQRYPHPFFWAAFQLTGGAD